MSFDSSKIKSHDNKAYVNEHLFPQYILYFVTNLWCVPQRNMSTPFMIQLHKLCAKCPCPKIQS